MNKNETKQQNERETNTTRAILLVQGAQWGSEGKGSVAAALCRTRKVRCAVRTGAVNAGHTVYKHGRRYVMQQLPVGWVAGCDLYLGPGAYVNPEMLLSEISTIREVGYAGNIYIDHRVGLHLTEHTERSALSGRHYRIGATGKGCSEAILDRIRLRGAGGQLFHDWWKENRGHLPLLWEWADVPKALNDAYNNGWQILLEGTQGHMLDLYLGPYPYTTHKQCIASQWVTEAGLSPSLRYEVVSVVRTYPIRVAGNSGPMPSEIDWPTLAKEINAKMPEGEHLVSPTALESFELALNSWPERRYPSREVYLSEHAKDAWSMCSTEVRQELSKLFEFTTVTKKLRRVARMDRTALAQSVLIDRPSWVCVTFMDYEFPQLKNRPFVDYREKDVKKWLDQLETDIGAPVRGITTGPDNEFHAIFWGGGWRQQ
jgi:adenylosuccinate synthase